MQDSEIKVGDIVRVRSWDDMASEYTVDADGDILITDQNGNDKVYFLSKSMRRLCGLALTVSRIIKTTANFVTYKFVELTHYYDICAEMLEPYCEIEYDVADDEEISNFLA